MSTGECSVPMSEKAVAEALAAADAICLRAGSRFTRQRRAVLAVLLEAGMPLSAYDLLDRLRPVDPMVKPVTIYRALDFLLAEGLVHRLETTRSYVPCAHPDHPHAVQFLICRSCGKVVEAHDRTIAKATADLGRAQGFVLDQPTVELTGQCSDCVDGQGHGEHDENADDHFDCASCQPA
ncbi:Ferric uptake regulation protein [Granulibacter bethesdensis]|uniref:Ferric uptake regulation protein n=2 Tax=Granulibacter bethesdensis TaxID=364410 RepID=A0AAN0RDQ1_9PROT|nr:Ferric uptake regulation protein [Granulibacter bethesdensis]